MSEHSWAYVAGSDRIHVVKSKFDEKTGWSRGKRTICGLAVGGLPHAVVGECETCRDKLAANDSVVRLVDFTFDRLSIPVEGES